MAKKSTVLVVGTGTIGEPLIGLFSHLKEELGIHNVCFHKRTPLKYEIAKVNSLVEKGAHLVVDEDKISKFQSLGHVPSYTMANALDIADVVIDCTPAGNINKSSVYDEHASNSETLFIAQGSEKGFGVPYAWGINDQALIGSCSQFIQVVSCNTHAISRIITALSRGCVDNLRSADFVCIRRANDASQDSGFIPSPMCGKHTDSTFGTHHARDVNDLFATTRSEKMPIFSSALKVNTQYMHMIRFSVILGENLTLETVLDRLSEDEFVAVTHHTSTNKVFSFGRDHGFYGRIYNQAVVSLPSLSVFHDVGGTRITGFVMTPQDGNSLLSSISSAMYGLHSEDYLQKLQPIKRFLLDEV